tara:strand:+ start:417 stop:665 length:249 start_codon:yes stop_codon:yes gene_type:complete
MIIKFDEVVKGYFEATNVVSGHNVSVHTDMLGDYVAIVEKRLEDGTFEAYEDAFDNLESAMRWCECPNNEDNPVVLSTSFGA